ncbi:heme ABC transporter ATP-binding protein [Pseudomonas sp. GOM7]|uniref:heme ABC transporter ATP-binding protein n=1 Tax=Pseudomonas sp. GOM7 TaxID=2998079 RepID=UPI002279FF33|nr:heme ABC transporter ATP-binding protein [Pseudomonas sp. GOM7]WAJ36604.1 heme ABC transporter ATP-binding protein [Pseudomonas sp. GOM7]
MLRADNLGVRRGDTLVLQGIDLQVQPGAVLGVLGPNGAGKSTLLAALSGEVAACQGSVSLDGQPLASWPGQTRARRLAVLPQSSSLSFAFAVREVVAMGRLPHASGRQRDAEIVLQALRAADAEHLASRSYLTLSGGERQRVHLARVMAQLWPGEQGCSLLLDEPTSALDPLHQHTTLAAVRAFAQRGVAVLVILHDLNLAARYCDHLVLLHQGRAQAQGSPDQVLQADLLHSVFGLDVLIQRHPERDHPLIVVR